LVRMLNPGLLSCSYGYNVCGLAPFILCYIGALRFSSSGAHACIFYYRAHANTLVQHHKVFDTSFTDHEISPRNHAYTTAPLQSCLRDLRANRTRKGTHPPDTNTTIFEEILFALSEEQCLHKHDEHHPISLIQEIPTPQSSPSFAAEAQLKGPWNKHNKRHERRRGRLGSCSEGPKSEQGREEPGCGQDVHLGSARRLCLSGCRATGGLVLKFDKDVT
jgi:hypothetical protein